MPMKNPPHPGKVVRVSCLEPLGLNVTEGAKALGVSRQALSNLVNGHARMSTEMAVRLAKAFGSTTETWIHLQAAYDVAQAQARQDEIKVVRYQKTTPLQETEHPNRRPVSRIHAYNRLNKGDTTHVRPSTMSHDYEKHLTELRETYYRLFPTQRVKIAKQRIGNPSHGPNLIVTYVSAIEGILRSLVVWRETVSGRPEIATYNKYKRCGVRQLYEKYLQQHEVKSDAIVAAEKYKLVGYAVEYRNLLAHECTYLGQDKYPDLIAACQEFLSGLCAHAGINDS